jgi:4-amino-4-deoxy-L-arabinose transferase-like glycosyltransferase
MKIRNKTRFFLTILAILLFFFRCWDPTIIYSEELLIIDAVKSMINGGSYIVPAINHLPDFSKPPLIYWVLIPFYRLYSNYFISGRLVMGLFGIGILFLNYKYTKLITNKIVALWSSILLVSSPLILYFTKTINIDLPNTFFILVSLYSYEQSKKNSEWYWLTGLGLGLCVLTRSYFVIFPIFVIMFDVIYNRSNRTPAKGIAIIFITMLIVSLPWHILAFTKSPSAFLRDYIDLPINNHWFNKIPGDQTTSFLYYLNIFILFPPSAFGIIHLVQKRFKHLSNTEILLSFWTILGLSILTLAPTRHEWYLFPILPPLAILAGIYISNNININLTSFQNFFLRLMVGTIIISPAILLVTSPLPESSIITAVNAVEKVSKSADKIIELNYPLIPETTFFPNRRIEIISSSTLSQTTTASSQLYVIARTGDFPTDLKSVKIKQLVNQNGLSAYEIISDIPKSN